MFYNWADILLNGGRYAAVVPFRHFSSSASQKPPYPKDSTRRPAGARPVQARASKWVILRNALEHSGQQVLADARQLAEKGAAGRPSFFEHKPEGPLALVQSGANISAVHHQYRPTDSARILACVHGTALVNPEGFLPPCTGIFRQNFFLCEVLGCMVQAGGAS